MSKPTGAPTPKKILFYRLVMIGPEGEHPVKQQDWSYNLGSLPDSIEDRTYADVVFDPRLNESLPCLGMHKPINSDFMSRLDPKTATITDIIDSNDSDETIDNPPAHSTAVAFLPRWNAVGICKGSGPSSPGGSALVEMLNIQLPLDGKAKWKLIPIMDLPQISRFIREAGGASCFEAAFITTKDLFYEDSKGIFSMADDVSDKIGADVKIDIKITLPAEARQNWTINQRMLGFIKDSLPRLGQVRGRAKARAQETSLSVPEEFSFVTQKYGVTVDADEQGMPSHRFSELVGEVARASDQAQTRLETLLGG